MDAGTKDEQRARLNRSPLEPSLIVETKRGYQAYWNAKSGASQEHWNDVMINRMVPYFGADPNARDIARILRAPGFYHMKDPSDPFMVSVVYRAEVSYREEQMLQVFPDKSKPKEVRKTREYRESNDGFWWAAGELDCADALTRLSGHPAVGFEQYEFYRTGSGNLNIKINGKSTSCWIDKNGKLGSLDHGGPSIIQWLKWFGNNSIQDIAEVLKEIYPHLRGKK